jgi:prepilin-type N-terminal cleavage/methylation domain-containing protein
LCRSTTHKTAANGFTLVEVLVALSILAIALAPIGELIATSVHGARSIADHLSRLEIARAIMAALPSREKLVDGTLSGEIADNHWRVDVLPFPMSGTDSQPSARWVAQTVIVTTRSSNGGLIKITTIRLQRTNRK